MYVLLSKIGPYKIFFSDIHKTSPGEELESEVHNQTFFIFYFVVMHNKHNMYALSCKPRCQQVINAFMHLELKKFNSRSAERAFYIDSYEMASIWKGHSTKLKVGLFSVINIRLQKLWILKKSFVFSDWPVSVPLHNWYHKRPQSLDSYGIGRNLLCFLNKLNQNGTLVCITMFLCILKSWKVIMPAQKKTLFLDPLGESIAKVKKCQEVTRY